MNSKTFNFLGVLILFISFSCKKIETEKVENYSKLEKAKYLIGNWENLTPDANFKEIWKKENDSTFTASSFITVKKDTVFYENIILEQKHDSLVYIVSIKGENKDKAVSFYLTSDTHDELVFENPKHDYPTKIVYKKVSNDSLVATIYGMKDGKADEEAYPMKRTNN
ncbi:DUF6265 family protein [Flavobacterium sp.]|uniref:DUF6265 family protein n=1 Tax=Flavobacterium sp. TaxID=239 RepID=UPI0037525F25